MCAHNGEELSHAAGRIALAVKAEHGVDLTDLEVEDVIKNVSIRRDLPFEVEMAILLEALQYPITIAAVEPRLVRVGHCSTPSSAVSGMPS